MNVFYAPPQQITDHTIELLNREAHHAANVLRYKRGDEIIVVDGTGNKYSGIVQVIGKKRVEISIVEKSVLDSKNKDLVLALGLIKNRQRLEFAIEKAVELGATSIILFNSRYSEKDKVRLDRLEGIVISAMKQSMHARLPVLDYEKSLKDVLERFKSHRILMAHEKVGGKAFIPDTEDQKEILLLVGPEGGFSDEETELVEQYNGELVSLGRYRLRAETATIAFLSKFL